MKNHHQFQPKDFRLEGKANTGHVVLHLLEERGVSATSIELPPTQIHQLLVAFAQCFATSPVQETKALGQLFAVRNISAHHHVGKMITLKYESEIGVTLETTIEHQDAETLSKQLIAALEATEGNEPTSH